MPLESRYKLPRSSYPRYPLKISPKLKEELKGYIGLSDQLYVGESQKPVGRCDQLYVNPATNCAGISCGRDQMYVDKLPDEYTIRKVEYYFKVVSCWSVAKE
jgi:hypothetical protein